MPGHRLEGRIAVVTGAGSGIGAVTAAVFAAEGARVVVADIDADAARAVAAGIAGSDAVEVDIRDPGSVRAMRDTVVDGFGRVDVLVNNAMRLTEGMLLEIDDQAVTDDLSVGLAGAFHTCRAVLPGMVTRRSGVILNVASVNGLGYFGNDAYSAAKAGLLSLTTSIAARYGRDGIRCNAVAPGTIATPAWTQRLANRPDLLEKLSRWYPLGRIGRPEDVASALLFLASDDAAWITGTTLRVDGGLMAGNVAMTDELLDRDDSG